MVGLTWGQISAAGDCNRQLVDEVDGSMGIGALACSRARVVSHENFLIGMGNLLMGFVEADFERRVVIE